MAGNIGRRRRMQRVYIVLPAFNEELRIGKLLGRIEDVMLDDLLEYTVVVVDDGSTDATADIVRAFSKKIPLVYE